jgi:single-strand DNA-binding protein
MFGDINKITLMGNVTRDPELRYTPSGTAVLSIGLATNRRYKKGEEWLDEVTYHNIVIWNNAEELAKRIKKGTRVYIEGRISTRSWDSADGKKNYKTEVITDRVILISRYEGAEQGEYAQQSEENQINSDTVIPNAEETIDPNDLPF